jgi:hypothetical protein
VLWRVALVPVMEPLSRLASVRCRERGAGLINVCRGCGTAEMGSASFGTERQVMETTYTVGVVAASMLQGGMC